MIRRDEHTRRRPGGSRHADHCAPPPCTHPSSVSRRARSARRARPRLVPRPMRWAFPAPARPVVQRRESTTFGLPCSMLLRFEAYPDRPHLGRPLPGNTEAFLLAMKSLALRIAIEFLVREADTADKRLIGCEYVGRRRIPLAGREGDHVVLIDAVAADTQPADQDRLAPARDVLVERDGTGEEDDTILIRQVVRVVEIGVGEEGVVSLNALIERRWQRRPHLQAGLRIRAGIVEDRERAGRSAVDALRESRQRQIAEGAVAHGRPWRYAGNLVDCL